MKQNTYQNLTLLVFLRSANWRDELKLRMIAEHWGIAIVVISLSHVVGLVIARIF